MIIDFFGVCIGFGGVMIVVVRELKLWFGDVWWDKCVFVLYTGGYSECVL